MSQHPPLDRLYVLIVEDNILSRTVLHRHLTKAGITCQVASNGEEAIHALEILELQRRQGNVNNGFDVILMDVEMPVMDGLRAARHIRRAESMGFLPRQLIIALTGTSGMDQLGRVVEAGMDDGTSARKVWLTLVVVKPYHLSDLLGRILHAVVHMRERQGTPKVEQTENTVFKQVGH